MPLTQMAASRIRRAFADLFANATQHAMDWDTASVFNGNASVEVGHKRYYYSPGWEREQQAHDTIIRWALEQTNAQPAVGVCLTSSKSFFEEGEFYKWIADRRSEQVDVSTYPTDDAWKRVEEILFSDMDELTLGKRFDTMSLDQVFAQMRPSAAGFMMRSSLSLPHARSRVHPARGST